MIKIDELREQLIENNGKLSCAFHGSTHLEFMLFYYNLVLKRTNSFLDYIKDETQKQIKNDELNAEKIISLLCELNEVLPKEWQIKLMQNSKFFTEDLLIMKQLLEAFIVDAKRHIEKIQKV